MRSTAVKAVAGLVVMLAFAMAANAAPPPSSAVVLVCDRVAIPGGGADTGISVLLFADTTFVGGDFVECPANGGRTTMKIPTSSKATNASGGVYYDGILICSVPVAPLTVRGECLPTAINRITMKYTIR